MSKIRLHGSSSGYTEIAPVAASGNNTLTLPNDGTIISKDSNGVIGVTSITVGTGVTIGDGRLTASSGIVGLTSTGLPSGSIIQVVSATKTDVTSIQGTSSGGGYTAIPSLAVTIKPISATSKILITCDMTAAHNKPDYAISFRLYKAGSHLTGASGTAASSREAVWMNIRATEDTSDRQVISNQYLDTAGGTSAIIYQVYVKVEDQTGSPDKYVRINTSGADGDYWYNGRASSTITAMEIAA